MTRTTFKRLGRIVDGVRYIDVTVDHGLLREIGVHPTCDVTIGVPGSENTLAGEPSTVEDALASLQAGDGVLLSGQPATRMHIVR